MVLRVCDLGEELAFWCYLDFQNWDRVGMDSQSQPSFWLSGFRILLIGGGINLAFITSAIAHPAFPQSDSRSTPQPNRQLVPESTLHLSTPVESSTPKETPVLCEGLAQTVRPTPSSMGSKPCQKADSKRAIAPSSVLVSSETRISEAPLAITELSTTELSTIDVTVPPPVPSFFRGQTQAPASPFSPLQPLPFQADELIAEEGPTDLSSPDADSETPLIPSSSTIDSDGVGDPELGVLRLQEVPVDSFSIIDPELGILRIREAPVTANQSRPSVYWRIRTNVFWSDNVLSSVDPVGDGIFQGSMALRAVPALNSRTYLISSIEGNLVRYFDESRLDYNELELSLRLFHAFTQRAYVDVGWSNEQLFSRQDGDRFLNTHTARASLGWRNRFSRRLRLDTAYIFEYDFADPTRRNRSINRINASLTYQLTPRLETVLLYQFTLVDFTQQSRIDTYHQILANFSYDISDHTQLSLFAGGRLGDSSESFLDFDSVLTGITFSVNLPLF